MESVSFRKSGLLSIVLFFLIVVVSLFAFSPADEEQIPENNIEVAASFQQVISPPIPMDLNFSGEEAPLDQYEVKERLDRELMVASYFHSNTMLLMKRANRWFPVIEPLLKENGIPDDFKYLALIESGLDNVRSPKGASGYWQFLQKTAREYGLESNDYIDERYNLVKATHAACAYFNDSFEEYQNWTLVAAAYNAGKRRISESMEKQRQTSYYDLYLNEETSRYVFRILAAKTLMENPENYGFHLSDKDLYVPLKTRSITVNSTIDNLIEFATENGVSYKTLKRLNPWLRSDHLPNKSGRTYIILLPAAD